MDDSSLDLVENSGTRISGLAWVFFGGYAVIFIALAISPFDRTIWFVENAPIMLLVAVV
ncbi:MAG: putative membrane protein YjdF, partial [Urechidicola sp.]